MPRPAAIDRGSWADSVSRVPKLTSFSMLARTCSAETCCNAAVILGSGAGVLSAASKYGEKIASDATGASIREVIENVDIFPLQVIVVQGKPAAAQVVPGFRESAKPSQRREDLTVGPGELNIIRYDLVRRHSWFIVRNVKAISISKKMRSMKAKLFLARSAAPISRSSRLTRSN